MTNLAPTINDSFALATSSRSFVDKTAVGVTTMQFEPCEQPVSGIPGESCPTNLFFGFFFDGTKNNYVQAEVGKSHSNVARRYDRYPGLSDPGILPKVTVTA